MATLIENREENSKDLKNIKTFLEIVLLQRPDGQYEAEVHNFSPHGKGVYIWNNGDAYYGKFDTQFL
mgnify:CR=1 FL=1